jgi:hypothetical protein
VRNRVIAGLLVLLVWTLIYFFNLTSNYAVTLIPILVLALIQFAEPRFKNRKPKL